MITAVTVLVYDIDGATPRIHRIWKTGTGHDGEGAVHFPLPVDRQDVRSVQQALEDYCAVE